LTDEDRRRRKEELREYNKKYRKNNKKQIADQKRQSATTAKLEGIAHYGGKCSCCGEDQIEFLTLEHLNGRDKNKKRRTGKSA